MEMSTSIIYLAMVRWSSDMLIRELVDAVSKQMSRGSIYGAGHVFESTVAKQITQLMPSIEMLRFVSPAQRPYSRRSGRPGRQRGVNRLKV